MAKFDLEWLLERAKQNLIEINNRKEFYYTHIDEMMALEKRIDYIEKLIENRR